MNFERRVAAFVGYADVFDGDAIGVSDALSSAPGVASFVDLEGVSDFAVFVEHVDRIDERPFLSVDADDFGQIAAPFLDLCPFLGDGAFFVFEDGRSDFFADERGEGNGAFFFDGEDLIEAIEVDELVFVDGEAFFIDEVAEDFDGVFELSEVFHGFERRFCRFDFVDGIPFEVADIGEQWHDVLRADGARFEQHVDGHHAEGGAIGGEDFFVASHAIVAVALCGDELSEAVDELHGEVAADDASARHVAQIDFVRSRFEGIFGVGNLFGVFGEVDASDFDFARDIGFGNRYFDGGFFLDSAMPLEIEVLFIRNEIGEFFDVFDDEIDRQGEFEIAFVNRLDFGFVEDDVVALSVDGVAGGDFDRHIGSSASADFELLFVSGHHARAVEASVVQFVLLDVIHFGIVPVFCGGHEAFKKINSLKTLVFCHDLHLMDGIC